MVKLEFFPDSEDPHVSYSVQHCTSNETQNIGEKLEETGKGFKEFKITKDEEKLALECDGVELVTMVTFSSTSTAFPGIGTYQ